MLWFNLKFILNRLYGFYDYIWIDCTLIRETQKAVLIEFDGRKIWLPKAWIVRMKRDRSGYITGIKIFQYDWAKKIS